jgi:hypothetical protein
MPRGKPGPKRRAAPLLQYAQQLWLQAILKDVQAHNELELSLIFVPECQQYLLDGRRIYFTRRVRTREGKFVFEVYFVDLKTGYLSDEIVTVTRRQIEKAELLKEQMRKTGQL